MLRNFYKTEFKVLALTEIVDSHKIVKKEFAQVYSGKGALVALNQTKMFTTDKETVTSNYMLYCPSTVPVKIRDQVSSGGRIYEVIMVQPDIKADHLEVYLADYKVK